MVFPQVNTVDGAMQGEEWARGLKSCAARNGLYVYKTRERESESDASRQKKKKKKKKKMMMMKMKMKKKGVDERVGTKEGGRRRDVRGGCFIYLSFCFIYLPSVGHTVRNDQHPPTGITQD